jgi:hypothetical protein
MQRTRKHRRPQPAPSEGDLAERMGPVSDMRAARVADGTMVQGPVGLSEGHRSRGLLWPRGHGEVSDMTAGWPSHQPDPGQAISLTFHPRGNICHEPSAAA